MSVRDFEIINENFRKVMVDVKYLHHRLWEEERKQLWLRAMVGLSLCSLYFGKSLPDWFGGVLWLAVAVISLALLWMTRRSPAPPAPEGTDGKP